MKESQFFLFGPGYFRANVSKPAAEMSHLRCLNNMIECERHPTLSFSSVVGALTACARYYFAAPINRYVCVYVAAALQILIAHKFNGYFHQVKELYGKKLSLSLYLTHCYLYETIFPFPLHK